MTEISKPPETVVPAAKRRRLLKVLCVAACALAGLILLGMWRSSQMLAEHGKVLDRARQALDAIQPAQVPPEQNAAPLYQQAVAPLGARHQEIAKFCRRLEALEVEIGSEEAGKLLRDNADVLKALAAAAAKPKCVFITDYSAGWSIKFPSSTAHSAGIDLLTIAARRAAHEGKFPEAAERLRQALHLCRGMGRTRLMVIVVWFRSSEERVLTALRDVLTTTEPDADWHRGVLELLREHSAKRISYRETMRVERTVNMYAAAEVAAGAKELRDIPTGLGFSLYRASGRMLEDARTMEAMWDAVEAAAGKPYHELFGTSATASEEDSALQRRIESVRLPYLLLIPSLLHVRQSDTDGLALLRCARLAVAARLHKLKSGRLPGELRELAEHFPKDFAAASTDPVSGKPLLYKRTTAGFVVYGVGTDNMKDDGAPQPYRNVLSPDVAFAVDAKLREACRAERLKRRKRSGKAGPGRRPPAGK
jgi:hypothetical protein